ncbi:hypothetical protein R3P38DRAFT_3201533 [Favolaschia claudopus]|uniref:Uncharacterized protein n=1 Tax=Favolaschia claudopus TaxID=2862362 RepID=A0AAW0AV40_9AGAR
MPGNYKDYRESSPMTRNSRFYASYFISGGAFHLVSMMSKSSDSGIWIRPLVIPDELRVYVGWLAWPYGVNGLVHPLFIEARPSPSLS